jgi:MFS superfamily sulfate permease-like transporter
MTLALSLDSEVDTNKELIAHGYSNFLAGLFGTVPNYLVYVNTLLWVPYPSSVNDFTDESGKGSTV